MDTGIHKSKYHWEDVSLSINIKVKEGNIPIVYSMLSYKLKVMHVEEDKLNLYPIRHNRNVYPGKDKTGVMISVHFFHIMGTCMKL